MKKMICFFFILLLAGMLTTGCGDSGAGEGQAGKRGDGALKAGLVVDRQQIMADPFQYTVWEGLENFKEKNENAQIKYLESQAEDEFLPNLDQLADEGNGIIIGAGFLLSDAMQEAAKINKDVNYVLLDHTFTEKELADNLTGLEFASEIPAFLAGYIAGNVTETGRTGFVGGISSEAVGRFEYGYRYGVAYAAKELGEEIFVDVVYTDTFSEALTGRNAAEKMYEGGCDVIFQAAGECGFGVIEAAKGKDKWVIGVDVDQYEDAPDNMLTSVQKHVDRAVEQIISDYAGGKEIGGRNYLYGPKEDAVGLPKENPNLEKNYPGLYEKTMKLEEQIQSGGITVPSDKETFDNLQRRL